MRNQPAPPWAVFDDLCDPHRPTGRPWLLLQDDETEPSVLESEQSKLVVWSSIWTRYPNARLRFDLVDARGGTDLRWTLYLDEPLPDEGQLRHLVKRIGELINAELRFTYGS
jgi:hypothetical protein